MKRKKCPWKKSPICPRRCFTGTFHFSRETKKHWFFYSVVWVPGFLGRTGVSGVCLTLSVTHWVSGSPGVLGTLNTRIFRHKKKVGEIMCLCRRLEHFWATNSPVQYRRRSLRVIEKIHTRYFGENMTLCRGRARVQEAKQEYDRRGWCQYPRFFYYLI